MLTAKQENFAKCLADGMTQADAYRTAYDAENMKADTIYSRASQLMADGKISARVKELRDALEKKALWTREMSVKALVAAYKEGNSSAKIAAVKELNLMHGYNEPIKHEVTGKNGSALVPVPVYKIVKK